MRLLFLTDNFPPEVNAPASRTYEHAKRWVEQGAEVTVITCAPNFPQGKVYPGYRNSLYRREVLDGIKVIRVWSYVAKNEGFLKRTLDYMSYAVMACIAGLFVQADLIIATSPQFFTALSGMTLSWLRRTPWVMEVRDLWPESIAAVGAMASTSKAYKMLEQLEETCYKSARHIVVVTDSFREKLIARGIPSTKLSVVKNGVDLSVYQPCPKDTTLELRLGLQGKTVIGYIGTHGMAHKLDFILRCARELQTDTKIHFLFIGTGSEKDELLRLKSEWHLDNVTMLDPVPKTQIGAYLSLIDVALVNLRCSDLFHTVIPSKIFESAAMQRPILIGVDGEARSLVEGYGAGLFFEPEDEEAFKYKLRQLLVPEVYKQKQEGCIRLAKDFDRIRLADCLYATLEGLLRQQ